VVVGRVVEWSLVAPQPTSALVWFLDMLDVQAALILAGFACGKYVVDEIASQRVSTRSDASSTLD
jgi:hypothetical protein